MGVFGIPISKEQMAHHLDQWTAAICKLFSAKFISSFQLSNVVLIDDVSSPSVASFRIFGHTPGSYLLTTPGTFNLLRNYSIPPLMTN
uniref:Uncharacterized protein n=1 Tax=Romanomermis culicivorax TaxID=13658 RepID=A0A915IL01_ROMCU